MNSGPPEVGAKRCHIGGLARLATTMVCRFRQQQALTMCATRAVTDECLPLDLANPAVRRALKTTGQGRGRLIWSHCGVDVASVQYTVTRGSFRMDYSSNSAPHHQRITLVYSRPYFGGRRTWFSCPVTGKAVRTLFLPPGATRWASRAAYDLSYSSQRMRRGPLNDFLCENRALVARHRRNEIRRLRRQERETEGLSVCG